MPPKKNKRNVDDDFMADFAEEEAQAADVNPEAQGAPAPESKPKKEKKKKDKKGGKKAAAFDSDEEEPKLPPPPPAGSDEEDEEEPAASLPKKGKKGKKGAAGGGSLFALLGADDEEGEQEEEEEASPTAKRPGAGLVVAEVLGVTPHPKASRLLVAEVDAGGAQPLTVVTNAAEVAAGQLVVLAPVGVTTPGSGLAIERAALRGVESEGMLCSAFDIGWLPEADGVLVRLPEGGAEPGEPCPQEPPEGAVFGKRAGKEKVEKGKQKGKKADAAAAFAALTLEEEGEGEEAPEPALGEKKKKKKKKSGAELDSVFEALAGGGEEGGEAGEEAPAGKKKKKKAVRDIDIDALLAGNAEEEEAPASEGKKEKKAKKEKNPTKTAQQEEDEDLDALLAELDRPAAPAAPAAAAPAAAPEPAGGKKDKKKKKGGKTQVEKEEDEDLDALLAELGMKKEESTAAAAKAAAPPAEPAPPAPAAAAAGAAEVSEDEGDEGGKEMSAAAKKKAKKKAKEKAKKAEEAEEAKAAGGKKVSAAVRRMQEALEAQRRAEEEAARAAEEARLREEEEERRAAEEEERKKEEAERRKAEKAARREALRKEGKLLTGKAKAEAERLARAREQFLKQAGLEPGAAAPKKKPVYASKKKGPAKKRVEEAAAEEAAPAEQAAEEAAAPAEQAAEEAAAAAEEPAEPSAAAAEAAAEEEAGAAAEDWEAAADDWEAMGEDDIRLPGQAAAAEANGKAEAASDAEAEADAEEEGSESGEERSESEEGSSSEEESSDEEGSTSEYSSSEEDSSDDESSSGDEMEARVEAARARRQARLKEALAHRDANDLRSPICCILGHVDTGKTKILDNIRRTNVQDGEAGGITQQIGATYIPGDAILARTQELRKGRQWELRLPGLLVIDTPGHESFSNLRSRGSGLCDIAVLVVDLMHGLEQQTVESINLLKMRRTPFVIAVNKIDRLYNWQSVANSPVQDALARQAPDTVAEFEQRLAATSLELNQQGLNVSLYWKNPDPRSYVNLVPTSAITGEGIPDLLQLLVKLTQSLMAERLMFVDDLQCTVLEVKSIEGLGTTIDVVLVNGRLREGDTIVVCGLGGPIVTTIRALLTPQPLREIRVKGTYIHHKELKAASGIKIAAHNLEGAVAGTQLYVAGPDDDVEALKAEVMEDMQDIFSSVDKTGEGVCVQASTLGSLEALLEFLRTPEVAIPVSAINIGPVHKRDVMRANVMIERGQRKFGVILAFDVPVTREARDMAEELGVTIFTADIIYHLFDQFKAYLQKVKEEEQEAARLEAVFPCVLRIMPACVFNKKDPIVLGVEVAEGIARVGTPLCIPTQGGIDLGRIASMEKDHKAVDVAKRGDAIAMKIESTNPTEASRLYGRHFDHRDDLVSKLSRKSIDVLKAMFRDELSKDDWRLVVKLKKVFKID